MVEIHDKPSHRLEGKVAIITGASSGIGAAAGRLFARQGAAVVLAARRETELDSVVEEITAAGGKALPVRTDVAEAKSVEALVQRAVETYGKLDIAFNNTGIEGGFKPLTEFSEEEFDRVIAINLKGVFLSMKYEIPAMLAGGGGSIVNNASTVGLVGWGMIAPYVASKHGMVGLTKSAALEYAGKGIRVNAIAPGSIRTEKLANIITANPQYEDNIRHAIPMGRMGEMQEAAQAALWLCSDAASFITGVTLPVDGGQLIP